ncbi:hypothetical protein CLOM_g17834 [Closterium sp. NIES-68]|nr:hypothetical protein CLOM_g17834 [Closterium sp. NIES-68]
MGTASSSSSSQAPCARPATLSFPVLYLLTALVQWGTIPPTAVSPSLYGALAREPVRAAVAVLLDDEHPQRQGGPEEHTERQGAEEEAEEESGQSESSVWPWPLPENYVLVFRVLISPLATHCYLPSAELANRVISHYRPLAHRFLRVTFTDEAARQLSSFALLREKSAWFIAEEPSIGFTVASVQAWMGTFSAIRNVAKCAARMGQCFSSRFTSLPLPRALVCSLPDVTRHSYCFTDGVGAVSPEAGRALADAIAPYLDRPCAGAWCEQAGRGAARGDGGVVGQGVAHMWVRPSMDKFESQHADVEVINWTRPQPCFLNRQIVTLLSTLGVPDQVFLDMQDTMVQRLDAAVSSRASALRLLEESGADHLYGAAMAMLRAGIHPAHEPHLKRMIRAVRLRGATWMATCTSLHGTSGCCRLEGGAVSPWTTSRQRRTAVLPSP